MQQEKIGNFIAQCRKKKNLTQSQLAEKLNMSDKSISKWETGKGMPDSSVMLELCKCLDISVNELLEGKYLGEQMHPENSREKKEDIEKIKAGKKSNNKSTIIAIFLCLLLIVTLGMIYNSFLKPTEFHQEQEKKTEEDDSNMEYKYFVRTYHILNISDSNDGEHFYLTVKKYQAEEVETIKVLKKLAINLKKDKPYEFTFQYKDSRIDDTNIKSILESTNIISITETDKLGMDQRQDPIR